MSRLGYQWAMLGRLERLIAIQVGLFILFGLLDILGISLYSFFELSSSATELLFRPWSLFTYLFLHHDLWHLIFNMLWLYYAGQFFLNFFDFDRLFSLFLLGGIAAGIVYVLLYSLVPSLSVIPSAMVGSSAGVMAVLIFMATYNPNQPVQLLFFRLKLWHLGAFFVVIDLLQLSSGVNFGGRVAHLTGAAIGYFSARQLLIGIEVAGGFQRFVGRLLRSNGFASSGQRKSAFKVYKSRSKQSKVTKQPSDQERIDAILDKISASGYDSLSAKEKEYLFKKGR